MGYPDARLGGRACAFVKLRDGATLSFAEMADFLNAPSMARQYFPERLEVVGRDAACAQRQGAEVLAAGDGGAGRPVA